MSVDDCTATPQGRLQDEFDSWARDGRGADLEVEHRYITQQVLELMAIKPGIRVLDLSCGSGWATRLLAARVTGRDHEGHVVGADISEEMLKLARACSTAFRNLEFLQAAADSLPFESNFFDKILSVEAFYYYPDLGRVLDEMYRVLVPGGQVFILINIYKDKPTWQYWEAHLQVKAHVLSEAEYLRLMKAHGFASVCAQRIHDRWQPRGGYIGAAARTLNVFRSSPREWLSKLYWKFKRVQAKEQHGALLLIGSKAAELESK